MLQFLRDLAFGARTLRRSPAFTVTALVTLALGIGASTAIFSVVNAVLLRSLPYARPDELVLVTADLTKRNVRDFPLAAGDLRDMQVTSKQLSGVAGVFTGRVQLTNDEGRPEATWSAFVTTNFFTVLGAPVFPGRAFEDADGAIPPPAGPATAGSPPPAPPPLAAILSYDYWRSRYGGDTKVIGTSIPFGGGRALVVGVAQPGLQLMFPPSFGMPRDVDVFIAARPNWDAPRQNVQFRAIGRLAPGATIASARRELDAFNADLDQRFPLRATSGNRERMEPLHANVVADVRPALIALMGGVTFVLLIACANVANLILVRTSRRERELAVRAALGGSRGRLVRQMLAEALVLGVGGAAIGVLLAELGVKLLVAIGPANLPRVGDIGLDTTVLGFTLLASLAAVTLFGVVPALRASRPDVMGVLRATGRSGALGAAKLLRDGVVIAEVTLAFVLLVGSGLMLRTFAAVARVNPGFDPEGVLEFSLQPRARSAEEAAAFFRVVRERLAALPGVTAVTAALAIPFDGDGNSWAGARWGTADAVSDPDKYRQGDLYIVEPGYFEAMRLRLVDGRTFTEEDNVPAATSIVVDEDLAKLAFPGESAVGKQLSVRYRSNDAEFATVVGVVAHSRSTSLASRGREAYYVTDGERGFGAARRWAVRTSGSLPALGTAVRTAVAEINPLLTVSEMRPLDEALGQARAPTRFALILIGIFAAVAALLSAVGLYGVLASVVRERTAELGMRVALGATPRGVFQLVIRQGMVLSAIGVVLGVVAALGLTRVIRSLLVDVSPTDPLTFVAIGAVFFVVAIVACWLPARRAAGVDPVVALRVE